MKKFYKKTGRKLQFDAKEPVGFDKTKVECYNCHKTGHFARECRTKGNQDSRRRDAWNSGNKDGRRSGKQEDSKALVTIDGEGVDWTSHSEEEEDYALMACNSLGSEAQLVAHQQGQLWYEQKIKFMKIDLDDKTDVLTYHKKLLAEAMKEKEDLKAKVEKWHNSSKNLGKLINTQMSANDKFGLGYGDHRYDGILSYENEVLQSVFKGKESDFENPPLYDRFVWSDAPIIEEYESDSEDEHMTGKQGPTCEYQDFNGGPVAFGGSKGYITGKGKIKTGKLDFEDVCFVKELQHFNLFSVSQMCDKKNKVLFTDSECLVLSPEFKLPDANQVLLRIPRQIQLCYRLNLENFVPSARFSFFYLQRPHLMNLTMS
ncbi:ribonuclease H-like domain-containing protein [Tanacetum coccineum]